MQITEHVSYKDATYSDTAIRNNISNEPNETQLIQIERCASAIFEPLMEWVGGPVKINSVFRSAELNKKIGGANSSQHCANNGAAFDVDDTFGYKTNKEMLHYIKDNLDFDQLIYEYGDDENPDWVHFSYNQGKNRKQVLRAIKENGKTKYINYE